MDDEYILQFKDTPFDKIKFSYLLASGHDFSPEATALVKEELLQRVEFDEQHLIERVDKARQISLSELVRLELNELTTAYFQNQQWECVLKWAHEEVELSSAPGVKLHVLYKLLTGHMARRDYLRGVLIADTILNTINGGDVEMGSPKHLKDVEGLGDRERNMIVLFLGILKLFQPHHRLPFRTFDFSQIMNSRDCVMYTFIFNLFLFDTLSPVNDHLTLFDVLRDQTTVQEWIKRDPWLCSIPLDIPLKLRQTLVMHVRNVESCPNREIIKLLT